MIRIVEAADIKLNPGESIVKEDKDYTLVNTGRKWQGKKLYQAFNNWNICIGSILANDDQEATDKLTKKQFEESLDLEEVCSDSLTEADSGFDDKLTGYITTIEKALAPIVTKAQEICKKVNLGRNIDGKSGDCTFCWYGKNGIQLFIAKGPYFVTLTVDENFKEWENLHAHLASQTPKPKLPLILKASGHYHALKGYYKASEGTFVQKEIGTELWLIVDAINKGDVAKAAEDAFKKADPSLSEDSQNESLNELFGFGKKAPKKRYIVGITPCESVESGKISNALRQYLNKHAEEVKPHKGRYFAEVVHYTYEFVCTAEDLTKIKNNVYTFIFTSAHVTSSSAKEEVKASIKWGTLGSIKESFEPDNWYQMTWN